MINIRKFCTAAVLSLVLALGTNSVFAAEQGTQMLPERIFGTDRYATSASIAENFDSGMVDNVIIASGNNFPDALSGSVLSKKLNAPILLVNNTVSESMETINYIVEHLNKTGSIYILGDTGAVSDEFVQYLKSEGFMNFSRLGGTDRFNTNKEIVDELSVSTGTPVIIANGYNFPDALSISSIAAVNGYPILLSSSDNLSDTIKQEIDSIQPSKIYVIGGNGAISNTVIDECKAILPALSDTNIIRISGLDRYETSENICKYFNLNSNTVFLASGVNFPDALSGSALAAKVNAPIIITDGNNISSQEQYIDSTNYINRVLLGGTGVISSDIANELNPSAGNGGELSVKDIAKNIKSVVYLEVLNSSGSVYASGSGFIVSSNGEVVTNYHVINGAYAARVTLEDGTQYAVDGVLGYSQDKDIAVLKLKNASGLSPVTLGNSDNVELADSVVAIGSPEGYQNTVSTGIISGLNRKSDIRDGIDLQTTAAIAPGSSGGALFDMQGNVIGMTYAGLNTGNIGFAIPINDVKAFLTDGSMTSLAALNSLSSSGQ